MALTSVSIIVPTHNRAGLLATALETILALRVPPSLAVLEVLIIDNMSTDRTAAVVTEFAGQSPFPIRRVLEDRLGVSHARNRGLAEAQGQWVLFFDDDVKVWDDWLCSLAEAAAAFNADCVTGPLFPWLETDAPDWCQGDVLAELTSQYSRKGDEPLLLPAETAHELNGGNFAVRLDLARTIGGFLPELDRIGTCLLGGGDWYFGHQLVQAGGRVAYHPGCRIEHFISARKMSKAGLRARWRGKGASAVAWNRAAGSPLSSRMRGKLLLKLLKTRLRTVMRLWPAQTAFRQELQTEYFRGVLFGMAGSIER